MTLPCVQQHGTVHCCEGFLPIIIGNSYQACARLKREQRAFNLNSEINRPRETRRMQQLGMVWDPMTCFGSFARQALPQALAQHQSERDHDLRQIANRHRHFDQSCFIIHLNQYPRTNRWTPWGKTRRKFWPGGSSPACHAIFGLGGELCPVWVREGVTHWSESVLNGPL